MNLDRVLNLLQFFHHLFINMKTSCSIQNNHVVAILFSMLQCCFSDIRRLLVISHGEHFHTLLLSVDLQLFNSCRSVDITCYQKRLLTFQLELSCKLCCGRCFTCSLKTHHHNDRLLASRLEFNLRCLRAHQIHQLVIHDLDHHLSRIQSAHHILSDCTLLHTFYKIFDNFEVNICLQKSHLNFTQSRFYIIFCKSSLAS